MFFLVLVTLYGIKNNTGKVVTFVTVHNTTQASVTDALVQDSKDLHKDGIIEQYFTFPGISILSGEPYRACVMIRSDLSLTCKEGHNSFVQRGEYIDLVLNQTK